MSSSPGSLIPLFKLSVEETGQIKDIKEIIVHIDGLPGCLNGEIIDMGEGVNGIVMGFNERDVLALVLGDPGRLRMGRDVKAISEPFKIPVGDAFVGHMVTAMGEPCEADLVLEPDDHLPVFRDSPPIVSRAPVEDFLPTGTKIVDMLNPLGKGQRQLILGDRMTGKTVIALDAIMNQKGRDCICIYCAVGKSVSAIEKVMSTLHNAGALDYTVVMVAPDNAPVGEQYLVPFAAASMSDYFAAKGRDVLVVFDDLTKHAWAYRQLSLLLDRPPGREAYPGDIFYVQTQLMERAGKFNDQHGGGSITFLGIAETLQGDLTGYIPSNLASMCDGQICMSSTVFAEGFRPAVDIGLSLSIIGGKAQPPILKKLVQDLRAAHARYQEILKLTKISSGMSAEAEKTVRKGEALMSVLQQGQFCPVGIAEQVLLLYALQNDHLTGATDEARAAFRENIRAFAQEQDASLLDKLEEARDLTPELERGLRDIMEAYTAAEGQTPA